MMDKIAVLGPQGTFTERATKMYLNALGIDAELAYFMSMRKTFKGVETDCKYGVIPIENTLDGFVQIILDLLDNSDLKVIHEIVLPIQFAFVANTKDIENIKKVYVQFKSENQCLDYLEQFSEGHIITTASNSQSFEQVKKGISDEGAIIPIHLLEKNHSFPLIVPTVTDSKDNETRFLIVSKELNSEVDQNHPWKTLFVIRDDADRSGLLRDILNEFSKDGINLKSIISRPTKRGLGNYNFFIDIEGCYQKDEKVRATVSRILDHYHIKILGSYYRVTSNAKKS